MRFDSHLPPFCLLFGYVLGSVTSNEPPRYLQGITNDSSLARRSKKMSDTIRRNKRKKRAWMCGHRRYVKGSRDNIPDKKQSQTVNERAMKLPY